MAVDRKRLGAEDAQARGERHAAARERQRIARARLAHLRAQLREALEAKKRRMAELVRSLREQRHGLRDAMRARRADVRRELRQSAESARAVAREGFRQKKADAKLEATSAIALARKELLEERKHQAQQRRLDREERARNAKTRTTVDPSAHADLRAHAVAPFRSLFHSVKDSLRPGPGESMEEAFLTYAESHPDVVHAHVEPVAERTLARTQADIAATERELVAGAAAASKPRRTPSPSRAKTAAPGESRVDRAVKRTSKAAPARATPPVEPPSVPWRSAGDDRVLCARCGCKGGQHRGVDGKCPSTDAWGRPSRDPLSNHALEGAALDEALARYWSANATFYRPVTATGRDEPVRPAPERTPNAYEEKKAARVDRMRNRARKLTVEAGGAHARATSIASHIPRGQPILVGHHSEKRHRRDVARIDRGFRKSFELSKEAEELARRADFAERNRAISSDDPSAVGKLRVKLAELNANRAKWKMINTAIRKGGDVVAALARLGIPESAARDLLKPDFVGRVGVPDYKLTNAGSEARRLEKRIAQLEAASKAPEKPPETIGLARIFEEENRVRVAFPSMPPEPLRRALKAAGFRWSPTAGAWQRHASHGAWYDARRIAAATV